MVNDTQLSDAKRDLLEKYLQQAKVPTSGSSYVIPRRSHNGPAPLSLTQEQIWRNAQRPGVPPFYNESITVYRKGTLDIVLFERCLLEILRRHETWRTTIEVVDGQPVQVVHPAPSRLPLTLIDLRDRPESEREAAAAQLGSKEVLCPFDLVGGPLFRPTLVRMKDDEYRCHFAVHQIIIDGVTAYHIFLPELVALYDAFSQGKPSPLPELPIQNSDFALWQRGWMQGEVLSSRLAYWRKQLEGAPTELGWPNERPRPARQTFRATILPFTLPRDLSDQVRSFSQSEGVTSFVTLLTGFYTLLHVYTGKQDIVLGTVSPAGRQRSEVQKLMGYFLNPIPLRLDLSGNPTVRELLFRVQRVSVSGLSNDDVPFEHLVEVLKPKVDPTRNPFFQMAASLEPSMPEVDPSWNLTPMDVESGGGRWDIYLVWDDRPGGFIGRVQYNPDILEVSEIDTLLEHQEQLLPQIVSNPHKRLSEITIKR
jgi:hypothetical protein